MYDQQLILELVEVRIKQFLHKHKQRRQSEVWHNCGLGATPLQFQLIIDKLEANGLVKVLSGKQRGVPVLEWVEQHSPENV